jgi:uncharacterized damage-inducible protein DinB
MSMDSMDYFGRMARYNRWMNTRLMETCSQLSDAERKQPRGAPFGSIHGLWNHLLLVDRLWLARFDGAPLPYKSLDEEICSDWDELKTQRQRTDDAIDAYLTSLTQENLAATLNVTALSTGRQFEMPLWIAVQQLFNHQTHHRGQLTALMEQAGLDCGVTDIAAMP